MIVRFLPAGYNESPLRSHTLFADLAFVDGIC